MTLTLISRFAAVIVCLPLATALIINSEYRSDNIFAVPDLIGCAILLTAALLPTKKVQLPFTIGFGWMAGVITTAAFGRLNSGDPTNALLNLAIATTYLVLAVLWARLLQKGNRELTQQATE